MFGKNYDVLLKPLQRNKEKIEEGEFIFEEIRKSLKIYFKVIQIP